MTTQKAINPSEPDEVSHWGQRLAEEVIAAHPDQDQYTCAAGISPSGTVHFGNFRDLFTAFVVNESLLKLGKKSRLIFSWDNFDRFRKVPQNVDQKLAEHLGKPYVDVPWPSSSNKSYASRFQDEFISSMDTAEITPQYFYQAERYRDGDYDNHIVESLKKRKLIAEIMLSFMSEKAKKSQEIDEKKFVANYFPIILYSRFTGKDSTSIVGFDEGFEVTYRCRETKQTETIDIRKDKVVKLPWKVDWPMRWMVEGVSFEPGGHDHASPGGSFDTCSIIAREVFNIEPPVLKEYKFVGLQGQGSKMSGSKGNVVSPSDLLEIYSPKMLKWLYAQKPPSRSFELSFGKGIFKQYDEYDRMISAARLGDIDKSRHEMLELLGVNLREVGEVPSFRQLVGLGQIFLWDPDKVISSLQVDSAELDTEEIKRRLSWAKTWLERYNPEEVINLRSSPNSEYAKNLAEDQLANIRKLRNYLLSNPGASIVELNDLVYSIPKLPGAEIPAARKMQRRFFKDVYNLLISSNSGPRLSTFLWALDATDTAELLDV